MSKDNIGICKEKNGFDIYRMSCPKDSKGRGEKERGILFKIREERRDFINGEEEKRGSNNVKDKSIKVIVEGISLKEELEKKLEEVSYWVTSHRKNI